MKEKILAAIKAKFPAVNLSKKRLDEITAKIESKVTEESQIDAQIDVFNDFNPIEHIAKNDDLVADLKGKLKKPATPTTEVIETPKVEEPPADPVLALLKEMKQELATLKGEKIQETYATKAKTDLADIPAIAWEGRPIPTTEEGYSAFVNTVKESYAKHVQESTDKGLAVIGVPRSSQSSAQGAGKVDNGLKAFLKKQNDEAKAIEGQKSSFITSK